VEPFSPLPAFAKRWHSISYVLQLLLPAIKPAMQELPSVVQTLQSKLEIPAQSEIGVFGFSAGGIGALLTLLESPLSIKAAVLAGVTKNLTSAVETYERGMKQHYPTLKEQFPWMQENQLSYHWSEASMVARHRLDFVARASEMIQRNPVLAILFVHGLQDNVFPLSEVEELHTSLVPYYKELNQAERLSLRTFEHFGHQLDLEAAHNAPAIQKDLTELQQVIASWFSQHLVKAL
jgi:predicted esterase